MKGGHVMAEQQKFAEELKKMEFDLFLPVEKKLIAISLISGLVLLGFFIWTSFRFFPGGH